MGETRFKRHGPITTAGVKIGSGGFDGVVRQDSDGTYSGELVISMQGLPSFSQAVVMLAGIADDSADFIAKSIAKTMADEESESETH